MGYDLYWRRAPRDEARNIAAAKEVVDKLYSERDALPESEKGTLNIDAVMKNGVDFDSPDAFTGQSDRCRALRQRIKEAHAAYNAAERSYFRFNMSGMSAACRVMLVTEMTFYDDPRPPWPAAAEFGITNEHVNAARYPQDYPHITLNDELLLQVARYNDAQDKVLQFHGKTDTPGIPDHKFGSNDGWIVLPVECEAAARIWDTWAHVSGDNAVNIVIDKLFGGAHGYWREWVAWLREAARHDGFTVR